MFAGLPDESKLWVFALRERATPDQVSALKSKLGSFISEWRAHGAPVAGSYQLLEDQFLLVAADSRGAMVSGCSIDSMFTAVHDAVSAISLTLADPSIIFFRDGDGSIRAMPRAEFKGVATASGFDRRTPVFNPVLTSVGELRGSGFELPFEAAWHSRAFR